MLRLLLDRPLSILVASSTLVVLGVLSLLQLPVAFLPQIERPRLTVVVEAKDRGREDLLYRVIEPIEHTLLGAPGLSSIASTVDDEVARVTVEADWDTDLDLLRIDIERRLASVVGQGAEWVIGLEPGDRAPLLEIAVTGGTVHERTRFAEHELIPELSRLPGAGQLTRVGGALLHAVVRPRAADLAARGLTALDVEKRLRLVGQSQPVGAVRDGGRVRSLVAREPVRSVEELRQLRFGGFEGFPLAAVATVRLEGVPGRGLYRVDDEDAVLVELHRATGANAVLLADAARETLDRLEGDTDLALEVVADRSLEVRSSVAGLASAGLLGLVLGTIVLRLGLGSFKPTLALVALVPASVLTSFSAFYLWGIPLDVVGLAGLALAIGMLVDNAIVVLEAIDNRSGPHRHAEGTQEVALALLASFLTTAVVFLPLLYLKGLARAFFGVQAFALVSALAVSLVFSLTLTPVLSRIATGAPREGAGSGSSENDRSRGNRGRTVGQALYERSLRWTLDRARASIVFCLGLIVVAGVAALVILPQELLPEGRSGRILAHFRLSPSLDEAEASARPRAVADAVEGWLDEKLGADAAAVRMTLRYETEALDRLIGEWRQGGEIALSIPSSINASVLDLAAGLEGHLGRMPGVSADVRLERSAIAGLLARSIGRYEVVALAASADRAAALSARLRQHLDALGIRSEPVEEARPRPAWSLTWDRQRLAAGDVGVEERWGDQVRAGAGGSLLGAVEIEGVEPGIWLEETTAAAPDLLPVRPAERPSDVDAPGKSARARSAVVPLRSVASLTPHPRPPLLMRLDGRFAVHHRLAFDSRRLEPRRLSTRLEALALDDDESLRLVGEGFELDRSLRQLGWALLLATVLVFLTLATIYESLRIPWVVLFTLPVALSGALLALWLSSQSLNVLSLLGVLLLAGVVVNNSIVLVHRIEQRRHAAGESGSDPRHHVLAAATERYRPIVMTTTTTLLGMLPLILLGGDGVELRRALATAVSGGLAAGLLGSLFLVPAIYSQLHRPNARQDA